MSYMHSRVESNPTFSTHLPLYPPEILISFFELLWSKLPEWILRPVASIGAIFLSLADYIPLVTAPPFYGRFCSNGYGDLNIPKALYDKIYNIGGIEFLPDISIQWDTPESSHVGSFLNSLFTIFQTDKNTRDTPRATFRGVCSRNGSFQSPAAKHFCSESHTGHIRILYPERLSAYIMKRLRPRRVESAIMKVFPNQRESLYTSHHQETNISTRPSSFLDPLLNKDTLQSCFRSPTMESEDPMKSSLHSLTQHLKMCHTLVLVGPLKVRNWSNGLMRFLTLRDRRRPDSIAVTGVSLGGGLAMYTAILGPADVDLAVVPFMGCPGLIA